MPVTEIVPSPKGRVRAFYVPSPGLRTGRAARKSTRQFPAPHWVTATDWSPNTILYEWGAVVGNLMATRDPRYCVSGMYLEFANTTGTPSAPAYTRADASAYYNGLGSSGTLDYLRVPVIAAPLTSSSPTNFPKGNVNTFYAMSRGTAGVHGKPFASGSNSKVYGAALVALVDPADASQDLVLSRFYFPADQQLAKPPGLQLAVEWEITWQ